MYMQGKYQALSQLETSTKYQTLKNTWKSCRKPHWQAIEINQPQSDPCIAKSADPGNRCQKEARN